QGSLETSALNALTAVRTLAPELQAALQQLTTRESELAAARRQYTDKHHTVVELAREVSDLRNRIIPGHAGALLAQLRMRESDLQGQVQSTARQLREVPVRSTEAARLRRNVASRENLYN